MLPVPYSSILQARSREEFRDEIVRAARQLGFDTVAAMTVIDPEPGEAAGATSRFIVVDNTPPAYRNVFDSPGAQQADPVMQYCKEYSVPLAWNQDTYVNALAGPMWEEQAVYGYRAGVALALHLPDRHHFMLGVERDGELPNDPVEMQRLLSDVQLFTVYAMDAAMRLLVPVRQQPERPALTPREVEALSWTMAGKTAWEVGRILGISERTAVLHISNAMRKLDCSNKHQAVLKALRLGLIH
ncbi:LuxR family transcriptional regulator [Aquincola sp. S2]|uniref:LuxR family transcriptional regulator n=1 Tax=Pseudaquabacterium terrae TaxID=2732868 RepID=A0ABX2EL37_9BURK|nr:LuxR family transcriptional regulator [Aquabacterium terrae]NRF69366.1 LuxR family transcriptional regulator [Aquabacterium terrae]